MSSSDEIKKEIEKFLNSEFKEAQEELMSAVGRFQYDYTDAASGNLRRAQTRIEYLVEISGRMKEIFTLEEPEFTPSPTTPIGFGKR